MSSGSLGNSQEDTDVFLKCLSKFYQNDFDACGLNDRKILLRDSIVKAYNKKFKTKFKAFQLLEVLRQNEKFYQPYEWQKLFLDVFNDEIDDALVHQHGRDISSNGSKLPDMTQNVQKNITEDDALKAAAKSSSSAVVSIECKPDIPTPAEEIDYKTMSVYELKRALLISKLEMLDAQEALKIAKENIRLNEEEHLKRSVD